MSATCRELRWKAADAHASQGLLTYPLPWWGLQASATYQSVPGPEITWAPPAALIAPSLGRGLAGGALAATAPPVKPGTLYGERLQQVDVRVGKTSGLGTGRISPQVDIYNLLSANAVLEVG